MSSYERNLHSLMTKGLAGDDAAYQQFLQALTGSLRAFVRRKLYGQDNAQAEDLVQEAVLAVHLHRHSYDPSRPVTTWVYAIARYKLIDHYRRAPRSREFVAVDAVEDLFSESAPDAADPAHDVEALLRRLPPKQSAAIRLVKLEEFTAKEAAARMGVSEADIKVCIHRGLKKLMVLVAKEDAS